VDAEVQPSEFVTV
jgi:hypothetical protein